MNLLYNKRFRDSTERKENNNAYYIIKEEISDERQANDKNNNNKFLNSKLSAFKLKKALFESPFLNFNISENKLTNELTNKRISKYKIHNGKTIKLNLLNIIDCIENEQIEVENEEKANSLNVKNHNYNKSAEKEFNYKIINNQRDTYNNSLKSRNFEINGFKETQNFRNRSDKIENNDNRINNNLKINLLNNKEEEFLNLLTTKKKTIFQDNLSKKESLNEYDSLAAQKTFSENQTTLLQFSNFKNQDAQLKLLCKYQNKFDPKKRESILNKLFEENKKLEINEMLDYIFENKQPGNKSKNKKVTEEEEEFNSKNNFRSKNKKLNEAENANNINNSNKQQKRTIFCTCKKTNCSKYYCFCLKNGLECGINCVCNDCDNKCKKRFNRNANANNNDKGEKDGNKIFSEIDENKAKQDVQENVNLDNEENVSSYKFSFDA